MTGAAGRRKPAVLTIAGSDNSAGAGAQADLKTFQHFKCYGLSAITCVVAEVPGQVAALQPVRPDIVASQIALSLETFPVRAAKTGLLYSSALIEIVAEALDGRSIPIIVDPVMVASSGDRLLQSSAVAAYRKRLLPLATLVTPNLDELAILAGRGISDLRAMEEAGRRLVGEFGCAVLAKGGHLRGRMACDLLVTEKECVRFEAPFVRRVQTHGTGCTYSAAITCGLAQGRPLRRAVGDAKKYVTGAIRESLDWDGVWTLEHDPGRRPVKAAVRRS